MPRRLIVCANCGHEAEHYGHGLCAACRAWEYRHGTPRPPQLWTDRPLAGREIVCPGCQRKRPHHARGLCGMCYRRQWLGRVWTAPRIADSRECSNCGGPLQTRRRDGGRCPTCARYRRSTGRERSPALIARLLERTSRRVARPTGRQPVRQIVCPDCQRARPVHARGLCVMCYRRRWRCEELPPSRRDITACQRCGVSVGKGQHSRGRCHACYVYWYRTGRERPLALLAARRRPQRPGPGWQWDGEGWQPPPAYCRYEHDYPRKPLCGVCGNNRACAELAAWRRETGRSA